MIESRVMWIELGEQCCGRKLAVSQSASGEKEAGFRSRQPNSRSLVLNPRVILCPGNKGAGKTTSGCRKGTLPGEDNIRVCLERWVDFQEAEMGEGLFPSKWMTASVMIRKPENSAEEWHLGDSGAHDKEKIMVGKWVKLRPDYGVSECQ